MAKSTPRFERTTSLMLCHNGFWFTWDPGVLRVQVRKDLDGDQIYSFRATGQLAEKEENFSALTLLEEFRQQCIAWAEKHHEAREMVR